MKRKRFLRLNKTCTHPFSPCPCQIHFNPYPLEATPLLNPRTEAKFLKHANMGFAKKTSKVYALPKPSDLLISTLP
jgi:hypothetical protein